MTSFQVECTNSLIFIVFVVFNFQNVTPLNLSPLNYISVDRCCLRDGSGNCSDPLSLFTNNSYFDLPQHLLVPSLSNTSIRFELKKPAKDEKCKNAKEVEISLKLLNGGNATDDNMMERKFTLDGFFKYGDDYFSPEEYCVKSLLEEHLVMDLCLPDCDKNTLCLTRCCELGKVFDFSQNRQCVSSGEKQWEPTVYKNPTVKLTENETRDLKIHFVSRHPKSWCDPDYGGSIIYSLIDYSYFERSLFRILEDGSIVQKTSTRRWETLSAGTYCIEGTQNIPGLQQGYTGDENQTILVVCDKPKEMKTTSISIIYGIAQIISCVFLLMTVIVYALLWEKQNIHGWTLLGYVTSMLCLYMLFVTTYFYIYLFNEFSTSTSRPLICKYLAVVTHFFFLSTFCWMTLINFDLYSTFKNLKPTAGNSKRKRRFFIYALFAFGLPLLIVATGITLDNLYGEDIESEVIVPQYGKFQCFLDMEYAALPYLYGPIGILLICNLLFFVITVYSMYRIQQTTKIATNNSSQRQSQRSKQKSLLFLKILSVMGIQWISEVINWAFFGSDSLHPAIIIFDIINILQPIAIFVIFVCKADICNSLRQKYRLIDRTATSLSIDALTADRIVHRWPKLERVIGPITRKEEDRRRRCMSTTTELTNLSVRQTSVSQIQLDV